MNRDVRSPEFGLNGAVLNSDTMTEPLKSAYLRERAKAKARYKWVVITVPLWIASMAASEIFGFTTVFPILMVLLVVSMLYLRFIKRRSWGSILWGLESSEN